ncbi:MAG: diguanylate cyclase [Candidatus Thiodiazotropha sp.]
MISIRLRIFLLAIVTLTAVSAAFLVEYRSIEAKRYLTENTIQTLDNVLSLSKIIHTLQKERGLSAGHLINNDEQLYRMLLKQREVTESSWADLDAAELLHEQEFTQNFTTHLRAMRQRIDSGTVQWDEVKEFYTSTVQRLIELIIIDVAKLDHAEGISYELQSLSYIASARENLGLIRAILNRGYQQGQLSKREFEHLISLYGAFTSNLRTFEAISKAYFEETADSAWLVELRSETFHSIISKIDNTLNTGGKSISGNALAWWRDATHVIDTMKRTENTIIGQIKSHVLGQVKYNKSYLSWYAFFAIITLSIVALLTALTVHRILKALSILIHSLENVEKTEDFGLRINTWSKDEFGQISHSINSLLSYTDRIIKDKEFLATTDMLTDTMNRRSFVAASKKEIKRSERYATPLSMIYCDIDFFKSINDQHGHAAGDEILKIFATTLKQNVRVNDYVGRWGGEEFVILAVETDLASAEKLSEKLRRKIMKTSVMNVGQVTSSFGVAEKKKGESFEMLCERADQALYKAKNSGRNKVCLSEAIRTSKAI